MRFTGWIVLAAVMVAAVTVTAFALTRGGGPTPPKRSLAGAIRAIAKDRPVAGVSAKFRIDTDLLPGSSSSFSVSPLNGATGTVWAGKGGVRLVVRSQFGATELGFSRGRLVLYDRQHRVAYVLPMSSHHSSEKAKEHRAGGGAKTIDVGHILNRLRVGNILSGAIPGDIAGRPEYTVRLSPRRNGGLFGAFELAWDAAHRIPLRFAVYPHGSSTPAFAITVTSIHYGRVPTRALTVRPPRGTKIVHVHLPGSQEADSASHTTASATGVAAVQRAVNFRLAAPTALAGLPRTQVRSVNLHGPAALVTYGRGLGTVFVLEQRMAANEQSPLASLPSASVNGAQGHELETTLGTLLQFSRGGVTYTVVGSRTAGTIMAAAQAIG
jgi:hypothetical protein